MANTLTTDLAANFVGYYERKMLERLILGSRAALFTGEIGILESIGFYDETGTFIGVTEEESTMAQMQPKELLVHLEKGDRTEEFVEGGRSQDNQQYGLMVAVDQDQMFRQQMNALQQESQRIGMMSAGTISGQLGGPTW